MGPDPKFSDPTLAYCPTQYPSAIDTISKTTSLISPIQDPKYEIKHSKPPKIRTKCLPWDPKYP